MLSSAWPSAAEKATQPPPFHTLPDIARKLRGLAVGLGAEDFVLFTGTAQGRPMPCMDSDYPCLSENSLRIASELTEAFATRMAASTTPCWWRIGSRAQSGLGTLRWAQRIPAPVTGAVAVGAGLALPLTADGGRKGFVVFCGDMLDCDDAALCAAHWEAFGLFAVVARLLQPGESDLPSVSRREVECLRLTAEGLTSEQIADRLGLSVHTANQYLANTTRKLNAVNRIHAVAKALRAGIID